jgi:hypothetical protein
MQQITELNLTQDAKSATSSFCLRAPIANRQAGNPIRHDSSARTLPIMLNLLKIKGICGWHGFG